jgi:4-hydroxy-2-oxoheptanedioate aldolase
LAPEAANREFSDRVEAGVDGIFVKLPATEVLEIAARDFDFAVVDLEHSFLGEREALALLQHARARGFPALVRVPSVDSALINRALEAGAVGIQLAHVRRSEDVREARSAMAFPPAGDRSVSTAHAGAEFGAVPLREYVAGAGRPLLVAQIEDIETEDPLEAILGAGADVAFIGTSDLSVAAAFDGDTILRRTAEIAAAAAAAGVVLGGFALDHKAARYRISCSDVSLLAAAATGNAEARRAGGAAQAVATSWESLPAEKVRDGVHRRGFGTSACLLVLNTCEPGMELRPHSHDFDQIALILSGHGRYHVGGVPHEVGPGSVLLVPAGAVHFMETTDEVVENLDVFAPAREDYAHLTEWMRGAQNGSGEDGPEARS